MGERRGFWRSFFDGMATVLDIGATYHRAPESRSDAEALADDWRQVGDDMRRAIRDYPAPGAEKGVG